MHSETPAELPTVQLAVLHERAPGRFITEASSCGFPPGIWPQGFRVSPPIGNGQKFIRYTQVGDKRCYMQLNGTVIIHVLND